MPKIIVHRGTSTIGGSCIEVQSKGTRLIFDLGMPLMESDGTEVDASKTASPSIENGILPDVEGLYRFQEPTVDAVFLSHAHIDHYGLMKFIHPEIPVYMSQGTDALVKIGNAFYPTKTHIEKIRTFEQWKYFNIGQIKIKPFLMDHSGPDASAFLIEPDGKKIFYTGDFRGHGRKGKLLEGLKKARISDLDCLLMEGTTLGGKHHVGFPTEDDVENAMWEVFANQADISFIMSAGSNVDRTVSIYRAALKARKTLVLDLYNYHLLSELKKFHKSLPPHDGDNIRILYLRGHCESLAENLGSKFLYKYKSRKIEKEEIFTHRQRMVLRIPLSIMKRLARSMAKEKPLDGANFIFSMWQGYLRKDQTYNEFAETYHVPMENIHTSGHAYLEDLKRLVEILKPKTLIPIHTLHGDDFSNHFENVVRLKDGQLFEIGETHEGRA
jgi:ribonuclease J